MSVESDETIIPPGPGADEGVEVVNPGRSADAGKASNAVVSTESFSTSLDISVFTAEYVLRADVITLILHGH
jgi:hypothetical protein